MIYYVTGGERSGKSSFAENFAKELTEKPYYLATSRIWDDDFQNRVDRHVSDRDENWTTIEEEVNISKVIPENAVVVIDCVTLWLTNLITDFENDIEKCLIFAKKEIHELNKKNAKIIIISNEIGMGLHAQTHIGRKFTELQGWVNQEIGKISHEAYFIVSGIPMKMK
ncbi:bifunctional adenosylcobinamide kinase/adenosylcobinamide-phosphate guanylyltransferase [Aureivirga sp. CE67]|uniref:bifunctional adenosylcobinamide kinase/adenosylcobinamide-phosphate guanylyltransferase n=1 Tax=Aureivirga sp. CE67 TaxID=1788983 RepID=UPI0018C9696C|nr:bifunctional adenosylcobinamide kinase/adenosylcobinamide-phosphate guanylyltransferase [Aureivirga sp. CE67]